MPPRPSQIRCTADKIQTGMDHPYLSDQNPYSDDPNTVIQHTTRPTASVTSQQTKTVHITRNATKTHQNPPDPLYGEQNDPLVYEDEKSKQTPYSDNPNAGRYKDLYTSTS